MSEREYNSISLILVHFYFFLNLYQCVLFFCCSVFQQTAPSAPIFLCNLSFLLLFVFLSFPSLPLSSLLSPSSNLLSGRVWALSTPPSLAWHVLTPCLKGRWRSRGGHTPHDSLVHYFAPARQIGSQYPSRLQDEYFWPHCTVCLTLLKKGLGLRVFS